MSDLYERLGVSRGASHEEIRKAYKDLSKELHPDRPGGNEAKFKQIQEAHEVLSDENRRRMYDMTGSDVGDSDGRGGPMSGMAAGGIPFSFMGGAGPFGMPGVSFDMSGLFGQMFGMRPDGGTRPKRAGKGPNKHHDVGLKLSNFYKGHEIKLKFNQARRCSTCDGAGGDTESCGPCNGSGTRTMTRQIGPGMIAQTRGACDVCRGEGKIVKSTCKTCSGKKFVEKEKQLDIQIRPGMREGQQLTFSGECSDTVEHEEPGDVVLTLQRADLGVGDTDEYEWKGDDLVFRKEITFAESILGFTESLLDHPNGESPTVTWRGGPLLHGAMLKMEGGGMPKKAGGYGNLYFQVLVTPPEVRPWTTEEATKLQSVVGGEGASLADAGATPLSLSSAEPKVSIDRT